MSNVIVVIAVLSQLAILGCASATGSDTSQRRVGLVVQTISQQGSAVVPGDSLRLVSINLAHGRKNSINQWFVSAEKTHSNLDDIAAYLVDVDADVVALQEADGPSAWSGGFDHVAYLAEKSGLSFFVYAEHARITMGNYGTAILSRWPIGEAVGFTFTASPPTANKGFTLAQIQWSNPEVKDKPVLLDVVSVHLDFSRKSVRREQIDEMTEVVGSRQNPLVIMGDFNSEWLARQYTVDSFSDSSPLQVYDADNEDLNTYKDKRLDWILLSRDLEFGSYRSEPELLSDHRTLFSTILLASPGNKEE